MGDRKESVPQEAIEQQLQQQVQKIRSHPPGSPERQRSLNQLVSQILKSGKLGHPQRGLWSPSLYEDLYNEALQKTLMEICQKIDQYNPAHPVMAWVNFRLNYQFLEVLKDYQKQGLTQMPGAERRDPIRLPYLEDLPVSTPAADSTEIQLQQFLQQDPEGLLQKSHLRGCSDITLQRLAIARFIDGKSWIELAAQFNLSPQTLCSFFNRQIKTLIPYFRRHLDP